MAERALKDFLTCSICLETFKEPASLGCHHSFCRSCLQSYFERNQNRNCPVCRRKSSKDNIWINFALSALCESFTGRMKVSEEATTRRPEKSEGETTRRPEKSEGETTRRPEKSEGETTRRPEKSERTSTRRPEELLSWLQSLKWQLMSEIQSLRAEEQGYVDLERTYYKMIQFNKKQAAQCEHLIRAEFSRLQSFLEEEEKRALSSLGEEQLRRTQKMDEELQEIREKLSSLSNGIKELEKHLPTGISSPQVQSSALPLIPAPSQSPAPHLQPKAGLLLDQTKVLGNLGFRVWSNMRSMVSYCPVILDPNTASSSLCLSEDLRGVRCEDKQKVPDNPERFSKYAEVLGSEGFSSGVHHWDVEVGDHPDWTIGVSRESVDRKGERSGSLERGIWALFHRCGEYYNNLGVNVKMETDLQKLRVMLDYNLGQVSFYDTEDMTLLCTLSDNFTEKLLPYFSVGRAGYAQTKELRVLPCNDQTQTGLKLRPSSESELPQYLTLRR